MTAKPVDTIAPIRRCIVITLAATVLSITPAWAQWPPDSFTNLKVLPKDSRTLAGPSTNEAGTQTPGIAPGVAAFGPALGGSLCNLLPAPSV
ncbi:MAG: hypothetical protein GTN62_14180 [Gemmatimonadales bacterium]|nr:hypothetical protein [Gemmatimonadales bacterium]NIN13219.1 hypothetical protein [Gemmatimonadales bacterium]NIN51236.1 hypothetical protein [Gemmatimonadales bacterium]NIP08700.1 hypothetical protein [Gemmatimonadales bacterium]NIR00953.1 hypothetical protein [Gemmatimonadales bacterium]